MVEDCITQWESMEGSSDLEKQVNAFLTAFFVLRKDIPADECFSEAQMVILLWEYGMEDQLSDMLKLSFAISTDMRTGEMTYSEKKALECEAAARLLTRLRYGQPWTAWGLEKLLED